MQVQIHDILHPVPNAHRDQIRKGLLSGKFSPDDLGQIWHLANQTANTKGNVAEVVSNDISLRIGRKVLAGELTVV